MIIKSVLFFLVLGSIAFIINDEGKTKRAFQSLPNAQKAAVEEYLSETRQLAVGDLVTIRKNQTPQPYLKKQTTGKYEMIWPQHPGTETFSVIDVRPDRNSFKLQKFGTGEIKWISGDLEMALELIIKNDSTVGFSRRGQGSYDAEMAFYWLN